MSRILVIEDDLSIQQGLADNLKFESYEVATASDGETACQVMRERTFDLIILDLMLPGMNGYEFCRRIRQDGVSTPVLVLTARSEEADRIRGLDLGADDYVTKPFSVPELLARIRALLRRAASRTPAPKTLRFGDVEIHFGRYEAFKAGKPIRMARKEFALLRYLAARAGEVVTREELLNEVWGYNSYPTTRTVDNHIASLRSKIEEDAASPKYLLTIHGVGYKLAI
jgi:DNA-binding response OmpR family regulator